MRCFYALRHLVLNGTKNEQQELLGILRQGRPGKQYPELVLNWEEMIRLDQDPLITIGAHTVNHLNLKTLPDAEVRKEMLQSKTLLEAHLQHAIEHFAYPYGSYSEAAEREYALAKECGFKTAMTSQCRPLHSGDCHSLPRYSVLPRHTSWKLGVLLSGWHAFWQRQM